MYTDLAKKTPRCDLVSLLASLHAPLGERAPQFEKRWVIIRFQNTV